MKKKNFIDKDIFIMDKQEKTLPRRGALEFHFIFIFYVFYFGVDTIRRIAVWINGLLY